MSYILDALRKSDQQRMRGSTPTLLAAQAAAVTPKRPPLLMYAVLGFLLLLAGVAIGWLRPWQEQQRAPAEPVVVKPPAAPIASAPSTTPAPLTETSQGAAMPGVSPNTDSITTADPAPEKSRPSNRLPNSSMDKSAQPPSARAPKVKPYARPGAADAVSVEPATEAATAASDPTKLSVGELPASLQKDLPAMSIMVHAYSAKPSGRLVGINGKLLHEGDEVASGLKLEEITPDGMILTYKGYTFHRGVH